jgi:hypothetical protein
VKRTPLVRKTPLRRGPGPRSNGIADAVAKHPAGGRRARFLREFAESKRVVRARSGGRCEVDAVVDCTGRAEHTHHRLGRVHPRANEPDHLLDVCHVCHAWLHNHPEVSYETGWLLHYEDVPKENDR